MIYACVNANLRWGNFVWYYSPRKRRDRSPKWLLQTSGPYQIVRRVNDVNYVIKRSERQAAFTVHVDWLRPYKSPVVDARKEPAFRSKPRSKGDAIEEAMSGCSNRRPLRTRRPPRRLRDFQTD